MKKRIIWNCFCLTLLLWAGACNKSGDFDKLPPTQINGVNVDVSQLSAEFSTAKPELQRLVTQGVTEVRYKRYLEAMKALDEALNTPDLTEKQKKLLTQVIGQLKEVVAKENK